MKEEQKLHQEGKAIQEISKILEPLEEAGKRSVVEYVLKRIGIDVSSTNSQLDNSSDRDNVFSKGIITPEVDSTTEKNQSQLAIKDIRTFAELKKPKSIPEQVAVVAFYLLEYANKSERIQEFTSEYVKKYFTQARFLSLSTRKKENMALINTEKAGYIDKVARGKYKLNSKGFDLVKNLLPRKQSLTQAKRPRSKKKKKINNN